MTRPLLAITGKAVSIQAVAKALTNEQDAVPV
jgi:hypothetical protein